MALGFSAGYSVKEIMGGAVIDWFYPPILEQKLNE